MKTRHLLAVLSLAFASMLPCAAETQWQKQLAEKLPLLGHRNWIVIVDSAYPWQVSPGVETLATGAGQTDVVKAVFAALAKTTHVRPIVYTDAELPHIAEQDAKGITAYRTELAAILADRKVQSLPHEQIIAKLDEAGKTFHVLVLKTKLTLPYTSVFLQLDCGYWNAESEKNLRETLKAAAPSN